MTESTYSNCEGLLGSLSDYIDGDLGAELCRQIEKHIAECENPSVADQIEGNPWWTAS